MLKRADHGLVFPLSSIMKVYPSLVGLPEEKERFVQFLKFLYILYELSISEDAKVLASSSFAKTSRDVESRRVQKVKDYIDQHYARQIRLEDLADLVGMSPVSFSRFFRQRTGRTLSEYIIDIRLGYAARMLAETSINISEISYHAMGVHVTNPDVKAIIDIGGQDVKGISIDTDGTVKNFAMNDKCAAGTGRFYEAMANAFEMTLPEFSKLSLQAKNTIPITAQCTVFAESEVISLVGEGKPMDEIAAGIQLAVAKRCFVMAKKAGATDSITLTGGCAKNDGLKKAIEKVLKIKVVELSTDPQLMGALGAAEYARQKGLDK
jgi:predicted CoA-substrate-specific enzyme activase